MSVREYVGARYVPLVVGDWDNTKTYEPLSVVYYQGASYTSRQYVPTGIEITNTDYWALSANYNAQVEAYRSEVQAILPYDTTPTQDSAKGVTSGGVYEAITEVSDVVDGVTPFDTTPTEGSAKGVTSGGVYDFVIESSEKTMLVFGDSWTGDGNGSLYPSAEYSWVPKVAQGIGATSYKSYAIAGYQLSTNFISQLNNAKSDYTTANDIKKVKWIIIFGGVNDWQNTTDVTITSFRSGLSSFLSAVASYFTSAQIVFVPMNMFWRRCGYPLGDSAYIPADRFSSMIEICRELSYETIGNQLIMLDNFSSFYRLHGQAAYRPDDGSSITGTGGTIHPNVYGNQLIAEFIINSIFGTLPTYEFEISAASNNYCSLIDISTIHVSTDCVNIYIHGNFGITVTTEIPASTSLPLINVQLKGNQNSMPAIADTLLNSSFTSIGYMQSINLTNTNIPLIAYEFKQSGNLNPTNAQIGMFNNANAITAYGETGFQFLANGVYKIMP